MRLQRDEGICNIIFQQRKTCNLVTMPRGLGAKKQRQHKYLIPDRKILLDGSHFQIHHDLKLQSSTAKLKTFQH